MNESSDKVHETSPPAPPETAKENQAPIDPKMEKSTSTAGTLMEMLDVKPKGNEHTQINFTRQMTPANEPTSAQQLGPNVTSAPTPSGSEARQSTSAPPRAPLLRVEMVPTVRRVQGPPPPKKAKAERNKEDNIHYDPSFWKTEEEEDEDTSFEKDAKSLEPGNDSDTDDDFIGNVKMAADNAKDALTAVNSMRAKLNAVNRRVVEFKNDVRRYYRPTPLGFTTTVFGSALWKNCTANGQPRIRIHDARIVIRCHENYGVPWESAALYTLDGFYLTQIRWHHSNRSRYGTKLEEITEITRNWFKDETEGKLIKIGVNRAGEDEPTGSHPDCSCLIRYTTPQDIHDNHIVCNTRHLFQVINLEFSAAMMRQPLLEIKYIKMPENLFLARG